MRLEDDATAGPPTPGDGEGLWCGSHHRGEAVVVGAVGQIDWASAPILREQLAAAMLNGPPQVVLDLSQVSFLDSSGLSVLIRAHHQANARHGWIRLAGPSAHVYKILHMTDLDRVLEVYTSVDAALTRGERSAPPASGHVGGEGGEFGPGKWRWPSAPGTWSGALNWPG